MSHVVLTVLTVLALVPSVGFVVLYNKLPWRSNLVGRSVMTLAVSLATLCLMGTLTLVFGTDYWGREQVRVFGTFFVVFAMWRQFITLIRVLRNPQYIDKVEDKAE